MMKNIWQVARWIGDYLEIPNYMLVRAHGFISGEKQYQTEEPFWRDVLGPVFFKKPLSKPRTVEGDVVVLRSFQLSPWAPRLPGLFWTRHGFDSRKKNILKTTFNQKLGYHYEPDIKGEQIRGGL